MIVDLHCHTSVSDCSYTVEEVITLAGNAGISHLAVTDHDTTSGLEQALLVGAKLGVDIIPGIEISAYDFGQNRRAHILGYYIEPGHPALEQLCNPLRIERHNASHEMVQRLIKAGYRISWELVQQYALKGTGVYKQHIMHALIDEGYSETIYGPLYKELFSRGDAHQKQGIAYIPIRYLEVRDAILAIRLAGGVPVLAHPGQFDNYSSVAKWVQDGLEGIEVWHPLHGKSDEKAAADLASTYQLVKTGGSDFHGFYGQGDHSLGSFNAGVESVLELRERKIRIGQI
jgi:predicted metal-dependent phosphoesterase TrpH